MKNYLPPNAIVFFPDGDKLCCVQADFDNLQESPAGLGDSMIEALVGLRADLLEEKNAVQRRIFQADNMIDAVYKSQGLSDFDIVLKRNSRHVATWPEWKRNILVQSGKATNDTPRTPIDATAGVH